MRCEGPTPLVHYRWTAKTSKCTSKLNEKLSLSGYIWCIRYGIDPIGYYRLFWYVIFCCLFVRMSVQILVRFVSRLGRDWGQKKDRFGENPELCEHAKVWAESGIVFREMESRFTRREHWGVNIDVEAFSFIDRKK